MRGLHCYDGHLHDGTISARTAAAHTIYAELVALARQLGVRGELSTSGTPTFPAALAFAGFEGFEHTVSPGTVVYWDARSEDLGIAGFQCAVEVQARVISRPKMTLAEHEKKLEGVVDVPDLKVADVDADPALDPVEERE